MRIYPKRGAAQPTSVRARLLGAAAASAAVSAAVLATSLGSAAPLGSPSYWPWLLTGLQVTALWAAGAHRWWGWPLGAAVQPPWIVYAVLTGQFGFIPGCAISCAVQAVSFVRASRRIVPQPTAARAGSVLIATS
ncbi:hypothetical protein [Demequina sp.]|uniref:hypothetical protein n=1 Tax=Demequina sp. TaxID=2050685 RepID=UPI0025E246AE|nr:hypothetical protein [Demequina sp.]